MLEEYAFESSRKRFATEVVPISEIPCTSWLLSPPPRQTWFWSLNQRTHEGLVCLLHFQLHFCCSQFSKLKDSHENCLVLADRDKSRRLCPQLSCRGSCGAQEITRNNHRHWSPPKRSRLIAVFAFHIASQSSGFRLFFRTMASRHRSGWVIELILFELTCTSFGWFLDVCWSCKSRWQSFQRGNL
jgi:hypothetical protein